MTTYYKGFNADWTCRGFQFEVGQTYTHDGPVNACESGFHACENPWDVWSYYGPCDVRYAEVLLSGDTHKDGDNDSKIAAASITISAELSAGAFVKKCVDWIIEKTRGKDESGYSAQIGSSGNYAQIGSSGDYAQIGSSGYSARIGSSGYSAQIGSSGDYAKIGSSGDYAQIGSSGDYAQIGSSGDYAQIGSSGDYAQIGSSGYSAQIGSSGNSARIKASGENSVISSAGIATEAEGAPGTWISLAEFKDGNCIGFATGCIGQDGLLPDVFYTAKDGKLIPA
jgi:hypothetical protein